MESGKNRGSAWAISAGLNAALAAIAAKLFTSQIIKYGAVIFFNVIMWACYVNSLKALSSLQATVTNFATNFLTSGLAGYFLFQEALSFQIMCWLLSCMNFPDLLPAHIGAMLIVVGVLILSKSSTEKKGWTD